MEREQHDGRDVVLERVKQSQSLRQLRPEIFNRDQGCQFTKAEWTSTLASWGGRIGMDGRGQWMDHVFIERLWRSLKYENLYMHKYRDVTLLEAGIGKWLHNYNVWRPHAALENSTQISMYCPQVPTKRRIK